MFPPVNLRLVFFIVSSFLIQALGNIYFLCFDSGLNRISQAELYNLLNKRQGGGGGGGEAIATLFPTVLGSGGPC